MSINDLKHDIWVMFNRGEGKDINWSSIESPIRNSTTFSWEIKGTLYTREIFWNDESLEVLKNELESKFKDNDIKHVGSDASNEEKTNEFIVSEKPKIKKPKRNKLPSNSTQLEIEFL